MKDRGGESHGGLGGTEQGRRASSAWLMGREEASRKPSGRKKGRKVRLGPRDPPKLLPTGSGERLENTMEAIEK